MEKRPLLYVVLRVLILNLRTPEGMARTVEEDSDSHLRVLFRPSEEVGYVTIDLRQAEDDRVIMRYERTCPNTWEMIRALWWGLTDNVGFGFDVLDTEESTIGEWTFPAGSPPFRVLDRGFEALVDRVCQELEEERQ